MSALFIIVNDCEILRLFLVLLVFPSIFQELCSDWKGITGQEADSVHGHSTVMNERGIKTGKVSKILQNQHIFVTLKLHTKQSKNEKKCSPRFIRINYYFWLNSCTSQIVKITIRWATAIQSVFFPSASNAAAVHPHNVAPLIQPRSKHETATPALTGRF